MALTLIPGVGAFYLWVLILSYAYSIHFGFLLTLAWALWGGRTLGSTEGVIHHIY